jgi:hypothetical protein
MAVAFDRKGDRVITGSADNTARIWPVPPSGEALVAEVRKLLATRAPEPLIVPEETHRGVSYGAAMLEGLQTLTAWMK